MHTGRLADSLQQEFEYDLSGSPAESCPVVHTHLLALKSAIRVLRQKADPAYTTSTVPTATSGTVNKHQYNMEGTPTVPPADRTEHQDADSPPPPVLGTKLTPRNLDLDLDMDMPEALRFDNSSMAQLVHSLEGGKDSGKPKTSTEAQRNQPVMSTNPEPVHSQEFRNSCGKPQGIEERIKYLEHHAEVMIANKKFADERAQADSQAVADREIQIVAKAEELHTLVENHIEEGIEKTLRIEEKIDNHDIDIKTNASNILAVDKDLSETKSRFEMFIEKADRVLKTQQDAEIETKEHLALLKEHMDNDEHRKNQPYMRKLMEGVGDLDRDVDGQRHRKERHEARGLGSQKSEQDSTLNERGEGDRQLIDYHLTGLTLLYFELDMQGKIGETRAKIGEKLGLKHVDKSLNFLGENDNNITEVCVPSKFARWFAHLASEVTCDDRMLGPQYVNCNQFFPKWDNMAAIPADVQRKDTHSS